MKFSETINNWKKQISEGLLAVYALLIIFSVCSFIYQCYLWLKTGSWVQFPIIMIFEHIPGFKSVEWIYNPSDWLGVHEIIEFILNLNSSIFLLLSAGFIIFLLNSDQS